MRSWPAYARSRCATARPADPPDDEARRSLRLSRRERRVHPGQRPISIRARENWPGVMPPPGTVTARQAPRAASEAADFDSHPLPTVPREPRPRVTRGSWVRRSCAIVGGLRVQEALARGHSQGPQRPDVDEEARGVGVTDEARRRLRPSASLSWMRGTRVSPASRRRFPTSKDWGNSGRRATSVVPEISQE
jgi:hypothetical protein